MKQLDPPRAHAQPTPGPTARELLPELEALRDAPLEALRQAAARYGGLFRYGFGPLTAYVVTEPEWVQQILVDKQRQYSKNTFQFSFLSGVAGNGLLSSDGAFWLRQRRMAQPAFHRQRVAQMADEMLAVIDPALARLRPAAERGAAIAIEHELLELSMGVVGRTLFSSDFEAEARRLVGAVVAALDHIVSRAQHPLALPWPFPTARNRRYRTALRTLDETVYALIAQRRAALRAGAAPRGDLLGMLLAAQAAASDEVDDEQLTDQQLRDELITLIIAGHETVATALTWACIHLARFPRHAQAMRAEVDSVLGDELPSWKTLPRLRHTRMIWEETLRLYPPTWILSRRAEAEDLIGGYRIPRGALVLLSPYVTQRSPHHWPDPDHFDPQRFAGEREQPRFAYFPFGGGPRLCIGRDFAMLEATLLLARLCQLYKLEWVAGQPLTPQPKVTLRPPDGITLRLRLRE